jgi:uncharacterized protein (TIGR02466 family)
MDKIEGIFQTPLFKTKLENTHGLDKELIDLLEKQKKLKTGRKKTNKGGFQTKLLESGISAVDKFHQFVSPTVVEFLKNINIPENSIVTLSPLWINSNKKDSYNLPHTHDGEFSLVYYLKAPKDCGSIVFRNPNPAFTILQFYNLSFPKFNYYNSQEFVVNPKQNDLLIFPSHLVHSVRPNENTKERISLSLNIYITDE